MYRSAIELTISGLPQNFSGAINERRLVVLCTIVLLHRTPQGAKFRRGAFKNRHFLGRRISRREEESKAAGMNE